MKCAFNDTKNITRFIFIPCIQIIPKIIILNVPSKWPNGHMKNITYFIYIKLSSSIYYMRSIIIYAIGMLYFIKYPLVIDPPQFAWWPPHRRLEFGHLAASFDLPCHYSVAVIRSIEALQKCPARKWHHQRCQPVNPWEINGQVRWWSKQNLVLEMDYSNAYLLYSILKSILIKIYRIL